MGQPLNPTEYPRSYRTSGMWLCLNVLLSLVFIVPALGVCWLVFAAGPDGSVVGIALSCVLSLGCVLSVLAVIASTLKSKVVLNADRIETHGLLSTRSLQRSEIQGRRVAETYEGWQTGDTWLIPRGDETGEYAENKITISNKLNADSVLREWIDSLPDLDATDTNEPDKKSSNKWALIKVLCIGIVFVLFMMWGYPGKGMVTALFAFGIWGAVYVSWGLRKYVWYWVTVGSMIALHLTLILIDSLAECCPSWGVPASFSYCSRRCSHRVRIDQIS